MDDFVGRTAELAALGKQYASVEGALVPIYGRRRVGKSELIRHFLRGKRALYHVGKTATGGLQLREFLADAARTLDEPLLAHLPTDDWRTALETVVAKAKGKLVLAFDEFQWLVGACPELPSVLQELWDRSWRASGKVMVILCGSYVGFMEREVLGKKSPLFGRRTAQVLLRPFGFAEAAAFHRGYSITDKALAYFICGGVPLYLRCFDARRSIESNVEELILDEYGPMAREPDFLLREELREVDSYFALLWAIAGGKGVAKDMAAETGLPERSLHYYLQQLAELGYVARVYPLSGDEPAARHVRFVLDDPLLRFWFRFVFPNQSLIQQMGPVKAMREHLRPLLARVLWRVLRASMPRGPSAGSTRESGRHGRGLPRRFVLGQERPDRRGGHAGQRLHRPRGVQMGDGFAPSMPSHGSCRRKCHVFPTRPTPRSARRILVRKKSKQSLAGVTVHDLESFL